MTTNTGEGIRKQRTVTVCSHCLRATCWQGLFYCDEYRIAGTVEKTREVLEALKLEHPDYWIEKEEA